MATCNCVEVNLSNLDLTQGGQDLWIIVPECGSQNTTYQIWSSYTHVMTPSGPTLYLCVQNPPLTIKYQYGIAGVPIANVPPNSSFTVGGTCTTVQDCYTPPSPSPTTTPTPTPTNVPCSCICIDSNLPYLATGNTNPSFNDVVEINYTDCSGNPQAYYQTVVYAPSICLCTQSGVIDSVLFYQDDVLYFSSPLTNPWTPIPSTPNYSIGYFANGICYGDPCGPDVSPTPTKTQTPTITPTNTVTPTVTSTNTPTPSTTPIICGSGTTTGTYYYTDCCGNFVQGTTVGLIVSIDYTKPYNGVVKLNVPATTVCASPTPTPTPTITPTNTVTPTVTPTNTQTPTPTNTPKVTPSNSPYVKLKNECDVVTLFDMGLQCYQLAIPTSTTSNDGILAIQVTGGTAPYSYYWASGQRTQTLVGVPQGDYEVTVVDYYGDYTATTVCGLFPISPTPTNTVTPTPTSTPAPVYPNLCLIYVSSTISYGPIQFTWNGNSANSNGKPTWSATYNQTQLDIEWSSQNSRWEIQGWTFTIGIPVSVNTSNVPDSGWSIAGGQQAQLSMTQGNCPAYLPLQSVPTSQNTSCPAVSNGSITLVANYGVPPYEYSINNGQTYQLSNVFQGLSPSTYTVITKDSANNTLTNQVSITTLGQNANYTIGVVVDDEVNLGPGSVMSSWHVNITPPLPFGTSISFLLPINTVKGYYLPGTGTINGTTVVKKNNVTLTGLAGQSSTPLVTAPRAFCSPYTSGTTTSTQVYSITMGYGDVVSGTSLSDLVITNGQVGANSCATKLEQSILINTVSPTITGGACNSVTNNPQSQGITNHTITQGDIPCSGTKWINWTGTTGGNFALDGGGTVLLTSTSSNPTTIQSVFGYTRLICPDKNPNTTAQGINLTGTYTYTFSQPVLNPLLAIYSLGRNNPGPITVTMSADTPFSIYCNTVSDPDYQIVYNIPNQTISGDEGYGIIQFDGLVNQVKLTYSPNENYTQLTWGLPCVDP